MNEPTDGDVIGNPAAPPKWRRASKCANGACVEVADTGDQVLIRDSKLDDGSPIVALSRAGFRNFIDAVKKGELGPVR